MPADYQQIREENIGRYGWDTAVLDLLGQLYSDRTHFIFELIQNAEDAGATELAFELFPGRLEVSHDGRPFTEADVRGVCGVGDGAKAGDLTAIGRFGIGFKSVYAYTRRPRVHSVAEPGASQHRADDHSADEPSADDHSASQHGASQHGTGQHSTSQHGTGEHFAIESFVRPVAIGADEAPASGTLFVFPFDRDDVPADTAAAEIGAALAGLTPRTLLFLRNIERIEVRGEQLPRRMLRRTSTPRTETSRHVTLSARGDGAAGKGTGRSDEAWLAWHRPLDALGQPQLRAEVAFRVADGGGRPRLVPVEQSPLVVFFPTQKETFTGFLIQGPYRTTPARDNVADRDPWNQGLVRETAGLLTGVLRELRDEGLLTADVLRAMPLDPARFGPGTMFGPLFGACRAALAGEDLIPVDGGGYRPGSGLKLAADPGLRDLLPPDVLAELCQTGQPAAFADASISADRTPLLHRYLRDETGAEEITPESFTTRATGAFLAARPDDWIARFYAFLYRHPALWAGAHDPGQRPGEPPGPARTAPILRREDGSQVAPLRPDGRPAAYLPGPAHSRLPAVRRAVAGVPEARQFLETLGLTEPDLAAEVLDGILPRYDGLDTESLDGDQHEADLEAVARALDEAPAARRDELLGRLRATTFLVAENAATGERELRTPPSLYQRTRELEAYFDGNPDAWFAAETYGPWRAQLRGMGVREEVGPRVRRPDLLGFVVVAAEFARHERGLDGFDPDAEFDGLEFALRHPSHARAEYIWNTLLVPGRQLLAGVVEKATRQGYQDGRREHVLSSAGAAATAAAWLPGPAGTFRRPADLRLDDLPPEFTRDEALARALGMDQAVVEEAGRRLGIPPDVLRGLREHPDLVALVEQELKNRGHR